MSFYKMHRGWMDDPVFRPEPYTQAQAWCWLIEHAAFAPRTEHTRCGPVALDRGQLTYSLRFLAKAWRWDKDRVSRFLERLSRYSKITTECATDQTLITICHYDEIQNGAPDGATVSATEPRQYRDSTATNNKKERNTSSSLRSEEGADAPPNPIKALFDLGVSFLKAERSDREARSLIGKWRSEIGDEELFKILLTANNKHQIERVSYMFGAVKNAKDRKQYGMGWRPLGVGG